jgi:SAM-dependent methyltransferase
MAHEKDYVLGTHDEELARLGLQHRVWRPRVLDAWRRAGFTAGQTLVDIGAGPGYATIDLAEICGSEGQVVAIERSRRFLDALEGAAAQRGLSHIEVVEADLDADALPALAADGAWVRWVFAFVKQPQELLRRVRAMLRPGGRLVVYEYFDYRTWRLVPRAENFDHFVATVMKSWRASGGEPDIGLHLVAWMEECGFAVRETRTFTDLITPDDSMWQWPKAFIATGTERLVDLGYMTAEEASSVRETFARATRCMIPGTLEIIAEAV